MCRANIQYIFNISKLSQYDDKIDVNMQHSLFNMKTPRTERDIYVYTYIHIDVVLHRNNNTKSLVFGIISNKHDNDRSFNALAIIAYPGNVALYSALHCNSSQRGCPAAS